jgi:hypothetical protein
MTSNGSLCFTVPPLSYGYHMLRLKANSSYLYPHIPIFSPLIVNPRLSPQNGSLAGGLTNISGNGFSKLINSSLSRVGLTCRANYTIIEPIYESPIIITLNLPPQTATQACTITYLLGNTSTTLPFQYLSSRTPSISFGWVAGYTYSIRKVAIPTINYDLVDLVLLDSVGAETKTKFRMTVGANPSTSFQIYPSNNYLPAGAYKIYAYAANYGFATVTNSTFLIQPFTSGPSLTPINSSFNGGKHLHIRASGFVLETQVNSVLVCGFESRVEAVD